MEYNIGATDRTVRIALGSVLLLFGIAVFAEFLSFGPIVGAVGLFAGVILLGTALLNFCPIYRLIGTSTR